MYNHYNLYQPVTTCYNLLQPVASTLPTANHTASVEADSTVEAGQWEC
jgi:hypothetical protein